MLAGGGEDLIDKVLLRYYLIGGMDTMAIKRRTLHLDEQDMKALARLARAETKATGIRVTSAGIIRRLIKKYLKALSGK